MKLLRENYAGKVKLIYIDPPYNTGHDFIYKDNFGKTVAADKSESGDYDDEGGQLVANPGSNGRFHSDWCSMIYPRLLLARDLLTQDGAIFISIDDNERCNLEKNRNKRFSARRTTLRLFHGGREQRNQMFHSAYHRISNGSSASRNPADSPPESPVPNVNITKPPTFLTGHGESMISPSKQQQVKGQTALHYYQSKER